MKYSDAFKKKVYEIRKEYINYHKHTHYSNIFTPDTHIKTNDYIDRIIELSDSHPTYFTTEHGYGGDIFEAKTICDEKGISCKFGAEVYIVPNPKENDRNNYHLMLIAKTDEARKKINLITSRANKEGFYYKPRVFIEDLLKLSPSDVYLTTACIAGICRSDESIESLFKPLANHFGESLMCEVQAHHDFNQIEHNKKILTLAHKYHLPIIAATDSHYIYKEQAKDRLDFLAGKHIVYEDEGNFVLDYPSYKELSLRFKHQGVLSGYEIDEALEQTLVLLDCEDIKLNKEIKMPTLYKNKTPDEKIEILSSIIDEKFKCICEEEKLSSEEINKRRIGIKEEMQVIVDTKTINTADYFLLNNKLVELATTKYGGILTRTGRGSCGAEYINRVLGITQIDRFETKIPLYPERFMSTARLLEACAMPDIDMNVVSQEPFVQATRELLGHNGCYPMIAYGTMKESEAFRNVCRSMGMQHDEYNEVAKKIDTYRGTQQWDDVLEKANTFIDTVVSCSVHPCAHLLLSGDIEEELGILKIGDAFCAPITSSEADEYKYLKNDYLIVSVWFLISETFKEVGIPIMSIKELLSSLDDDVWACYSGGRTCTLNQIDSEYATSLMRRYKAHSVEDVEKFVAALRPSFDPWRDSFINRMPYTTGIKELDKVLEPTDRYLLFQETLMQFFDWLGVTPVESISLIKKISKKKIVQEDFDALEDRLRERFVENTGSISGFDEIWNNVQSCMAYGFAAPHAYATAIDSLYGAYLKSHYPLQYFTVCLNCYSDDEIRTARLKEEASYYGIRISPPRYGLSKDKYVYDIDTQTISKGISSIKYMNAEIASDLHEISCTNPTFSFAELLHYLKTNTSIDKRQMEILIKIGYFECFGVIPKLLLVVDAMEQFKWGSFKEINKSKLVTYAFPEIIQSFGNDVGKNGNILATYKIEDPLALTVSYCNKILESCIPDWSFKMKASAQNEYLGYVDLTTSKKEDRCKLFVLSVDHMVDKRTGKVWGHRIRTRSIGSGKCAAFTIMDKLYTSEPINKNDVIQTAPNNIRKNDKGYWYIYDYQILE